MTGTPPLSSSLVSLPGVEGAPVEHGGIWHVRVNQGAIADAVAALLEMPSATLMLMAGEDRLRRGQMGVHYFVAIGAALAHVETILPREGAAIPTLAAHSFPASRFEREMRDLLGIMPIGHPDPRPLVRHGFWPESYFPLREDASAPAFADDGRAFPFTEVQGEGVYEIPVGPVHAGIIEPGHFRFSVLGETIVKMRARLYFTHKGTERLFAGRNAAEGVPLAERVSGDTAVGHTLAYCQALESLCEVEVPARAGRWRTVLLELERIYNHVMDAGAILADTGFPVGQAHCLRLREHLLRLNKTLTGHRLLRGAIVPGGLAFEPHGGRDLLPVLRETTSDFAEMMEIACENTMVRDRLDDTGRLPADVARDFGVVGYVARACGLARDERADHPFAAYADLGFEPIVENGGDVYARLQVRLREVRQSVDLVERAITGLPADSDIRATLGALPTGATGFGVVEAWRGRLAHMVIAGEDGRLHRVKIVDPSFFNWPALARALEDNIVPDFPLINKSFNQSYSGNDL